MEVRVRDRICLIIPPSAFLLDERVFMSLGILKIGAVLQQRQYHVDVLDLSGVENYTEAAQEYARSSMTDSYGITATTPQMPAVVGIVAALRAARPAARIVLGGPHGTLVHAAARREIGRRSPGRAVRALEALTRSFDVVVAGDGECAIFHALAPNAPPVIDADDPHGPLFLTDEMLETTPWPDRRLVEWNSYHYSIDGERATSLIAQLGCPFNCGFCGGRNSPSLRRIRTRSVVNIVGEVEFLYREFGVKGFMFYDDELNVSTSMVELMNELSRLQDRLSVDFKLRGFIKSQLFTDEQAVAMYRAGFRWILVGFESGSPRILRNIDKRATREENTRCMDIARRHGLKVKALMSIGHPGESEETVDDSRRWLLETRPDDFDVTVITVYPGTPYYDSALPHPSEPGVWVYQFREDRLYSLEVDYQAVAEYYKGDPDGGYQSFVYTDYLNRGRIVELRNSLERDTRAALQISYPVGVASRRFEHSMGQHGGLPGYILHSS